MVASGPTISGSSLAVTLGLGLLLLLLPRRYALAPLLISGCYMTLGQHLLIGEWHFTLIRILIAFGFLRLILKRELMTIKPNRLDKLFMAWFTVVSFLYVVVSGDTTTLNERLGGLYNAIGIYLLVRAVIRDLRDIAFNVKLLSIIMVPLAVPFLVEYTTGKNPFFVLGGVPEFTQIREGKLRCQGPFAHPILAGTFAATAVPLFVGLLRYSRENRVLLTGAILSATFIVVASSSSGPLLTFICIWIGLVFWSVKSNMRTVRWGVATILLFSHLIMKAPVWYLISRLADLTGGSGWYRSALIDAAVRHFDEWWLIGTDYTAHWMPTGLANNPKMADMVNYYVVQGVNGGLLGLILLILVVAKCFETAGSASNDGRRFSSPEQFMIWSLGCTVFGHVISFFSVSYFDQIAIFWYLIIGMISALVIQGGPKTELLPSNVGNIAGAFAHRQNN
jgi:hypothetical protein